LDKLRSDRELSVAQLHPTGTTALAKMAQKRWIERTGANTYRITTAGKSALKAQLPDRRTSISATDKPPVPEA
jgi:DNA-binding PadR family transcriptional regulator